MQNRLSQGLRALKYLKALMSTETRSGADKMPGMAGRGVFTETQPHEAIKGEMHPTERTAKEPFFFSPCLFCGNWDWAQASHMPGKHPISSYISSLALY